MPNWYTSRERVKRALTISGGDRDYLVDQHIEGASREIDRQLGRFFIPKTQERFFRWPQDPDVRKVWQRPEEFQNLLGGQILYLDEDLISVTTLQTENGAVTVTAGEFFLEPANEGPPYSRIEIDVATTDATAEFRAGEGPQRAIQVTGSWGYGNDTKAAGTISTGLASGTTATTFEGSDGSLIDVGDTLLIQSEQVFVSERALTAGSADSTNAALTADVSGVTVTTLSSAVFIPGEVIQIDSEKMFAVTVSGVTTTVRRAYDGSVLASHLSGADIKAFRSYTIVRGVNGTTAATHANGTAITKYQPPVDIQNLCRAESIFNLEQDLSGQTGVVGGSEGGVNVRPKALLDQWDRAKRDYLRPLARVL